MYPTMRTCAGVLYLIFSAFIIPSCLQSIWCAIAVITLTLVGVGPADSATREMLLHHHQELELELRMW